MRADELEPHDRIRHPETGETVEVTYVSVGLARCRVSYRLRSTLASFTVKPSTELEEM